MQWAAAELINTWLSGEIGAVVTLAVVAFGGGEPAAPVGHGDAPAG